MAEIGKPERRRVLVPDETPTPAPIIEPTPEREPVKMPEREPSNCHPSVVYMRAESGHLAAMKCVFGCDSPVVGIFWMPEGCYCHKDQTQALCQAHATSVQSAGPIICVIDFKEYVRPKLETAR